MNAEVRDIGDYQIAYMNSDFESVQARMRKRQLLELLEREQPKRILEIGCGTDALFRHWTAFERFVVVEPGHHFAAQARVHAADDARISIIEAYLEEAGDRLTGERFDLILVSGLLHEVPDPAALLTSVAGLCHIDTRIHVNVPNARSLHRLLALEMGLIADVHQISERQRQLQQPRTFDLASLRMLARDCGFIETASGSYFIKPFSHTQMARLQSLGMLDEAMLDGLWKLERHLPGLGSEIYLDLLPAPSRILP